MLVARKIVASILDSKTKREISKPNQSKVNPTIVSNWIVLNINHVPYVARSISAESKTDIIL